MFTRVPFRRLVTPLLVAGALAVVHIPDVRAARAHGRITGVVHLVALAGTPLRSGAYPSRRINPQTPDAAEIENVIVFVKDAPTEPDLTMTRASISQRDESFVPRVVAITRGSSVEFPNFDPYFHNVFSLSRASTFDLGRFPRGQSRTRDFNRAGLVKVFCHLHSDMSAVVLVFDHPWFTTPDDDGSFVLANVPAGRHTVAAWHERVGEARRSVEVPAGGHATVEFELPVVEP